MAKPTRVGILVAVIWAATSVVGAASKQKNSTRAMRSEAIQSIPFARLNAQVQEKIRDVVSKPSLYRRLPVKTIDCDPELYVFILRKPEVVVNIWQLMGITSIKAERTGPYTLKTADGSGTQSNINLVFGSGDTHVYYADVVYHGSVLKRGLSGKCVLVVKAEYHQTDTQRTLVTSRMDMFLQFDQFGLDLVARTLNPLVGKAADQNFVESLKFVSRVSNLAEANGPGMQRLVGRLSNLDPKIRDDFAQVAARVSRKALGANVASKSLINSARERPVNNSNPADALRSDSDQQSNVSPSRNPTTRKKILLKR